MSDTAKKIKGIIARQLEIKEEKVTENARITDDLGADSLDIIEALSILEEEFDIRIPGKEGDDLKTVGELISYIDEKLKQK
ncbi:MAG: acyl carrier protein [Candidatus Omnitrophica bacterium]|nr:acyl carrier protein [Candidatus Omnitrophota bacterium]MDD5487901.1 acyl carrier protein [Candidatus Omnitrophota bacterium]